MRPAPRGRFPRVRRAPGLILRGVGRAVAARPVAFTLVTLGVFGLSVMLPPLVLSVARRPWDHFTVNPWLRRLPEYLASPAVPWGQKLAFLSDVALFWFLASGPYGLPEWGFSVGVRDVARLLLTSLLFGAYFALWLHARERRGCVGLTAPGARRAGLAGVVATSLGLSTGPCSVVGCGAPVLPVVGLAFTGLTSSALQGLSQLSRVATGVVLALVALGVASLGWRAGADPEKPLPPGERG